MLAKDVYITGYARSKLSDDDLRSKVRPNLKGDKGEIETFLKTFSYTPGAYDEADGFQKLNKKLEEYENKHSNLPVGRLFYLALPPSVYPQVSLTLYLPLLNTFIGLSQDYGKLCPGIRQHFDLLSPQAEMVMPADVSPMHINPAASMSMEPFLSPCKQYLTCNACSRRCRYACDHSIYTLLPAIQRATQHVYSCFVLVRHAYLTYHTVIKLSIAENILPSAGIAFAECFYSSQVCKGIKENCDKIPDREGSWLRIVVEKPFGKDLESSEELADELGQLYPEKSIYRSDLMQHELHKALS